MKSARLQSILLRASLSLLLCAGLGIGKCGQRSYPELKFSYSPVFDRTCAKNTGEAGIDLWSGPGLAAARELQVSWDREAPKVLSQLVEMLGKKFTDKTLPVTIFACRQFSSMHDPFLVKIRWFYDGPSVPSTIPKAALMGLILHQVIHRYFDEHFDPADSTYLLTKYSDESQRVREHLHLFALIRAIYFKLGWEVRFQQVSAFEASISKSYRRAWEIVRAEGHEPFVKELKSSLR